jgi:hypothetical protein
MLRGRVLLGSRPDNEMSRRNKAPTSAAEATAAVRFLRPKPPEPVPEHMIETV